MKLSAVYGDATHIHTGDRRAVDRLGKFPTPLSLLFRHRHDLQMCGLSFFSYKTDLLLLLLPEENVKWASISRHSSLL